MAEKIEWNDSYLLGISEIDAQHKKLLALANDLYAITKADASLYEQKMKPVLEELTKYTQYHFSAEEAFMTKHGYSGVDIHKVAHDSFVQEVSAQIAQLTSDNRESGLRFYQFVANWVLTHIARADKVWASFVKPQL